MGIRLAPPGRICGEIPIARYTRRADHRARENTTLRLLFLRARANWRLLGVVGLGILVTSVLMASTTVYTRALTDLGLDFELDREAGQIGSVQVTISQTLLGGERAQAVRDFIEASLDAHFGDIALPRRIRSGRVSDLRLLAETQIPGSAPLGGEFTTIEGWESYVEFEGRPPGSPTLALDPALGLSQLDGPIEVALPRAQAELAGLRVGDAFTVADVYDDCDREPPLFDGPTASTPPSLEPCTTSALISLQIPAKVVGIFDALNPDDPFWDAALASLARPREPRKSLALPRVFALFVHSDALFGPLSQLLPGYRADIRFADPIPLSAFDSAGIPADLGRFASLQTDIASVGGTVSSSFEETLRSFQEARDFSVVPILLIVVQVVGAVVFFIFAMARLLVGGETDEIALLRSRGASLPQVLGLYALQLLPIVILAAAGAPLIAAAAVSALGFVGSFRDVTGADWITISLTPQAWALALAGAALAMGVVLVPVAKAARVPPGTARRVAARPAGRNVFQRYYLDIAFVAVAGFLVWSVGARDAVFTRDTVGGLSTEPLVLITPALVGLIAILLVLRLLPPALSALAWIAGHRIPMPIAAALRQAARNPGPVIRLTVLTMLAAAIGTFAASYDATVDRSFDERARFEAGVDLRTGTDPRPPGLIQASIEALPSAGATTLATRRSGSVGATGARGREVQILALDSARAASMLWFRDDFSAEPLATLLPKLRPAANLGGLPLPDDLVELSLWVNPSVPRTDLSVWLQVRDRDGRFFRVGLGNPGVAGIWQELRGDATGPAAFSDARPPLTLHAITYTEGESQRLGEPGSLLFDDLVATTARGDRILIEGFESDARQWLRQPLAATGATDAAERRTDIAAHSGSSAVEYRWTAGVSPGRRGLYLPSPNLCDADGRCALNVIVSETFLDNHGLRVGDEAPLHLGPFSIDVRIIAAVALFPTLDPQEEGGFLITDVAELHHLGATLDFRNPTPINELWASGPSDPARRARTVAALNDLSATGAPVTDQRALLATVGNDPLVAAGGSGILLIAFVTVAILVLVAFLVSVVLTARDRTLEMAVLRTLGTGRRALLAQLMAEYAVVAIIGLGLGTFLGDRIARLTLRFLDIDAAGDRVLPPFLLTTNWEVVLGTYVGLVATLALGVGAAWRLSARGSITRALRLAA